MHAHQQEIIHDLNTVPSLDPTQEIERRSAFLADYLGASGLRGFVLGISGGQDSLLAGLIAKRAVQLRRDAGETADFHAMLLPYGSQADRDDALLACDTIKPDYLHDFDIKPATDALAVSFEASESRPISDFDKGNVKARMRMIAQYAIAGEYGLLVIGTDHAAEAVTGFFTKYGDGGADVLPLSGLTKRQGRQLLKEFDVPDIFLTKQPTADLLDGTPGQADETELAMSYETIDDYLEGKTVGDDAAARIKQRYDRTRHKRALPAAYTTPAL